MLLRHCHLQAYVCDVFVSDETQVTCGLYLFVISYIYTEQKKKKVSTFVITTIS